MVPARPTMIRTIPMLGVGGTTLHVVQTVRQTTEEGASSDTIFLEQVDSGGVVRLVLPAKVCDAIARQRDSLGGKNRSKAAKRVAEGRKARGERPAFMPNVTPLLLANVMSERRLLVVPAETRMFVSPPPPDGTLTTTEPPETPIEAMPSPRIVRASIF
mgnify:CR=1 FL=1